MKRAAIIGALALTMFAGNAHAASETPDNLPPWVNRDTFGTVPSTGDAVKDCGAWIEYRDDLSADAIEIIEKCLDLHGWTYDEDDQP